MRYKGEEEVILWFVQPGQDWGRAKTIGLGQYFLTDNRYESLIFNLSDTDTNFYQRISSWYRYFPSDNYQTDTDTDFKISSDYLC